MLLATIAAVLARVQIQLSDVSVQISYRTPDLTQEYFLKAKISRYGLEYQIKLYSITFHRGQQLTIII